MVKRVVNVDFVEVEVDGGGDNLLLPWGEEVEVTAEDGDRLHVSIPAWGAAVDGALSVVTLRGTIPRTARVEGQTVEVVVPRDQGEVLRVSFVDVQQGDATLIQTPDGNTVVLDGGENQMFARFFASRFRGTRADARVPIDAIVVTHGDADHYSGLEVLHDAETEDEDSRVFVRPRRVFHNGLVKKSGSDPKVVFGKVVPDGDDLYAVDLEDDLTTVPDNRLNSFFKAWKKALIAWERDAGNITFRRLARGDASAFSFLDDDIDVEVLSPMPRKVGSHQEWGLQLLPKPREGVQMAHLDFDAGSLSASHTINGHSVVLRLTYGNVRMLFAGDLNNASEKELTAAHADGTVDLMSEVLKVPHHGSHEFETDFLRAVSPVVSVVSSGDEADKEYVHPRATLMNALGRCSRDDHGLVFVTELVAFFAKVGSVVPASPMPPRQNSSFLGFRRLAFGCVRIRTNGRRMLVFTDSGKRDYKEAYAVNVDAEHRITATPVVKAR